MKYTPEQREQNMGGMDRYFEREFAKITNGEPRIHVEGSPSGKLFTAYYWRMTPPPMSTMEKVYITRGNGHYIGMISMMWYVDGFKRAWEMSKP